MLLVLLRMFLKDNNFLLFWKVLIKPLNELSVFFFFFFFPFGLGIFFLFFCGMDWTWRRGLLQGESKD